MQRALLEMQWYRNEGEAVYFSTGGKINYGTTKMGFNVLRVCTTEMKANVTKVITAKKYRIYNKIKGT